jgi:hypothetical protein
MFTSCFFIRAEFRNECEESVNAAFKSTDTTDDLKNRALIMKKLVDALKGAKSLGKD